MLDAYDSPAIREIIKSAFTGILYELCGDVEDVSSRLKEYIEGSLTPSFDKVGRGHSFRNKLGLQSKEHSVMDRVQRSMVMPRCKFSWFC